MMPDQNPLVLILLVAPALLLLFRTRLDSAPPARRATSRWWGAALLAIGGALSVQPQERVPSSRRTAPPLQAEAPVQVAHELPDAGAGADASAACVPVSLPPTHSGEMLAEEPVYAAGHLLAVDHVEGGQ